MRLPERPGREMPKVHRVCFTTVPPAPSDLERHAPSVAGKFRPPGRAAPRGLTQPPGSARSEVPPSSRALREIPSWAWRQIGYQPAHAQAGSGWPFCFGLASRAESPRVQSCASMGFTVTRRPHKNSISPTRAPYGHACPAPFWCLASAQRALCDVPNGYVDRG